MQIDVGFLKTWAVKMWPHFVGHPVYCSTCIQFVCLS